MAIELELFERSGFASIGEVAATNPADVAAIDKVKHESSSGRLATEAS
jgi:hypothetical protein